MLLDLLPLSFPGLGGHAVAQAGCGGLLLDLYGTTCASPAPVVLIPITAPSPGIGLPTRASRRRVRDDDWLAILLALADDDAET